MNAKLKQFLKTPKGKLTAAASCMGISWIFLFFYLFADFSGSAANFSGDPDALRSEIAALNQKIAVQQGKLKDFDTTKKKYQKMVDEAWHVDRDGDPSLILRQQIENAAKNVDLKLAVLGSVRTSGVNSELYFAEVDITVEGGFEILMKFIDQTQKVEPELSWRRIFMNNVFRRTPGTVTKVVSNKTSAAAAEQQLNLNGTIRVLVYEPGWNSRENAK